MHSVVVVEGKEVGIAVETVVVYFVEIEGIGD